MVQEKGRVHIYYGDGKGKTTAACGLALRAAGWNKKVYLFFFFKSPFRSGEMRAFSSLKNFKKFCFNMRHPFFIKECDKASYRKELKIELNKFLKKIELTLKTKKKKLVILDEVLTAIDENLISKKKLIDLLKTKAPKIEVVLTGRPCPPRSILVLADYISEIKNLKHPYQKDVPPRKGIDF